MQRVDIVIVVLAVVALGGSIVGVMLYEPPAGPRWDVGFSTQTQGPVEAARGSAPFDSTWILDQVNVTEVSFAIDMSWTASPAVLQPVTVRVEITAPNGMRLQSQAMTLAAGGTQGSATPPLLVFQIAETPRGGSVDAENQTAALPQPNLNGTGEYRIRATVQGGAAPAQTESIQVTVRATYTYYTGEASVHTPDIGQAA